MRNPTKITDIVLGILERDRDARNSDDKLYFEVCKQINPDILGASFGHVLTGFKGYGVPAYESVGRARRLIQAQRPDLKATDAVRDRRLENEMIYEDYSKTILR